MAETLGMLCDKLTIVKLKQYHSEDPARLESLGKQEQMLQQEIDEFVASAIKGDIPIQKLSFASNKVYKKEGNETRNITGTIGAVLSELSLINCQLWHEQEKVYDFEKVAAEEKNVVVKKLAQLNLERNKCIDEVDRLFSEAIKNKS
jgi:hypothetical protein